MVLPSSFIQSDRGRRPARWDSLRRVTAAEIRVSSGALRASGVTHCSWDGEGVSGSNEKGGGG